MKLLVESDLPVDAKTAWSLFESEDFDARLEDAANIVGEVLDVSQDGDIKVRRLKYRSKTELPTLVAKALGAKSLTYEQTNRFNPATGRMDWVVALPVLTDRVSVSGSTTITDKPSGGCRRVVDGEITVRMRFVGGSIEKAVVAEFEKSMSRAVDLVRDLAREKGLAS